MKWNFIVLGALLVMVAVLTYIFFPVVTSADKAQLTHASSKKLARQKRHAVPETTVATASRHEHRRIAAHKGSAHLAKAKTKPIKPMTTLRESEGASHFGPPSKMYGGL